MLMATTAFAHIQNIDTNIDTGSRGVWLIATIGVLAGLASFVVCAASGLSQLVERHEDHHVYRWWALALGAVATLIVAGAVN